MSSLITLLKEAAHRRGGEPAIFYRGNSWSHADLLQETRCVATGLSNLGVKRGDRVAFWLPNTPAYLALYFACAQLGAIALAVNTRYRHGEVEDIVGRAGAKVLIVWPDFLGIPFLEILSQCDPSAFDHLETIVFYTEMDHSSPPKSPISNIHMVSYDQLRSNRPKAEIAGRPEDGCNIFPTSGTTRTPKFALHSQERVAGHGRQVARALGYNEPGTIFLQALPFCGVFGFSQLTSTIGGASSMVIMPLFKPDLAANLMIQHRCTHVHGTDDMLQLILDARPETVPFPQLKHSVYAAFNTTLRAFPDQAEARGMRILGAFGMSEIHSFYSTQPLEASLEIRRQAGGVPVSPQAQVRVQDLDSGRILPPNVPGEIQVTGPSLMIGYFKDPEATKVAYTPEGFFKTGDFGYLREDGSFVFLSRMGDYLRLAGFLVNPAEIEGHLLRRPEIEQVQVVEASTIEGNKPVAFLTFKSGKSADDSDLRRWCASELANFKVPVRFVPVERFPTVMGPNGLKIQRAKLREMAQKIIGHE
jgi:fatty-acyl-CoA synthase